MQSLTLPIEYKKMLTYTLRRSTNESIQSNAALQFTCWYINIYFIRLTFSASFFSLFIALNCFILERTALSIGLSDASPPSLIHGCSTKRHWFFNLFREEINTEEQNVIKGVKLTWTMPSMVDYHIDDQRFNLNFKLSQLN